MSRLKDFLCMEEGVEALLRGYSLHSFRVLEGFEVGVKNHDEGAFRVFNEGEEFSLDFRKNLYSFFPKKNGKKVQLSDALEEIFE